MQVGSSGTCCVMRIEEVYVDKRVMLMEGRETKEDRSGGGWTV